MSDLLEKQSPFLGCSRVHDVDVVAPEKIQAKYTAVIASPSSGIGVWAGVETSGAPLAVAAATDTQGTVALSHVGANFYDGLYTIAFIADLNAKGNSSICATVHLADGRYVFSQMTTLIVAGAQNAQGSSYLTLKYATPNGNTPHSNLDWVYLLEGGTPVDPLQTKPLQNLWIPTDLYAGTVMLQTIKPLKAGAPYIVEYNPGSTISAISAYYTFQYAPF